MRFAKSAFLLFACLSFALVGLFGSSASAAGYVDELLGQPAPNWAGGPPGGSGPGCQAEGSACSMDFDCCHGMCKNHIVCAAPLYCYATGLSCERDVQCCSERCNVLTHQCQ